MSLENIGKLFGNLDEMSNTRFKNVFSFDDMQNYQKDSFNSLFKVDSSGISEYTMEQIKAKASVVGLNESLTAQAVALASDADFTAKAASGKLKFKDAFADSKTDIHEFGEALKKSGKLSEKQIENLDASLTRGSDAYKGTISNILKGNADLADSFIDLGGNIESSSGKLGNVFKGLAGSFKSFFTSVPGILTLVSAGITAAVKAFDYFYVSRDEAIEKAAQSASTASTEQGNLDAIQAELDETSSKIDEIKSKGKLSLTDEAELSKLESQNAELERQYAIQQKITEAAKGQASKDAEEALGKKDTSAASLYYEDGSKSPEWMAWLNGGLTQADGTVKPISRLTDADSLEADIDLIDEYKKKINELKDEQANTDDTSTIDSLQTKIDRYEDAIVELESDAASLAENIQTQLGNITDKSSDLYKENADALDNYVNRGLSTQEKAVRSLDNLFSGSDSSKFMKQALIDAAKEGKNLEEVLNGMGLELSDLGKNVDLGILTEYFNELASSAEKSQEAIEGVDGTLEGVEKAFESANKGAGYDKMADYIEQANELYKNGKIGTDDFQTVVQWAAPDKINTEAYEFDAQAYKEAWERTYNSLHRWFDTENPVESMWNFADDLQAKESEVGKNLIDIDKTSGKIVPKFESTAEAAKALGINARVVDEVLHNLEDYGFEFDDVMFSGEGLEEYKGGLEKVKQLYEDLDDGASKKRLGKLIENWDNELAGYENDLSTLTEDKIVHIEFEYTLGSIESEINKVKAEIEGGANSGEVGMQNYAELISGNNQYISTAKKGLGLDKIEIPAQLKVTEESIAATQKEMQSATGDEKIELQAEIANQQEIEKGLLNAFTDANPEITPDTDTSVVQQKWNEFFSQPRTIYVNAELKPEQVKQQLDQLAAGSTINYNADVNEDNKTDVVSATKNENGTVSLKVDTQLDESQIKEQIKQYGEGTSITFKAKVDNVEKDIQAVKDADGNITYKANIDNAVKDLEEVEDVDGNITYTANTSKINPDDFDVQAAIDYIKNSQDDPEDKEALLSYLMEHQDDPEFRIAMMAYMKSGQQSPDASQALVDYIKNQQEDPEAKQAPNYYTYDGQDPSKNDTSGNYYVCTGQDSPSDKEAGLIYRIKGVIGNIADFITGGSNLNGTAHLIGSAHKSSGHAFSSGSINDTSWLDDKWKTKNSEVALTGEVGRELVVSGNRWWTVGDRGAEFAHIPKDSVVFNAKQTEELLSRGYINSRGTARLSGTAYANGGFLPTPGNNYQYNGTNTTSNNLNSASNNLSKAASDTSEAAEKLSEAVSGYTDWVEVLFKRLESQYDLLMSQMERIAHLPDKQQKLYEAMSKNSELLNRTQQAIGTYQSHFDSIVQQSGINPLIVHQIQNGSMDISKYDDDTQKIISELQSYYDKLVDCNKQYDDLLNKQSELAQTALDNIEDYIDMMTGIESSAVDYQEALRELAAAKGESAYSDNMYGSLQESIKNQQDVAGKLQSQIKSYQDEINKLMANGYMAEYSTEWFEAQAALNGFRQEATEAEKTLIELQDQLRELDLLKLQQVIDELDRTAKRLENNTDLTESKGEQVSEKDLQAQLDNANAQIQANYNKRQELLRDQAKYDVGSDKYNEYAEEIEKLDDAIFDAMENIEDLKNKIWEVRWQPFFDGQEALGDLIDQTDDLRGLLNSDAFVGKNGGLTLDGIANLALISQGMNAAKQQIKNYQEALKKLDEDLKNGNISTSEYKEQQKEFMDGIANSVGVVEDYRDSIVDLYTKMLEQENEVAQKSIDKQKELFDIKKKNADYNKTLRKQARDVNTLKAQISALEGVNNASAQAELKRLKAQLRDAEEEMQDTRDDHEYDVRQNGLDGLSEDLDKQLEETLYDVAHNAEKQEQVISQMLNNVVNNYQQAYDKIQQIINSTGFVPNKDLSNNLGNLGTSNGAQDQVDNSMTNAPNYRPDDWTDVNTGQIQNGTTQDKNDQIQGDISKNPDLSNRPVAEITLSPGTLSIQEGSTGTVSATIRPNDAKNKSLQWVSSNPDVATVANGTVHAVKAGSTTISAIATDGGGVTSTNSCAVTVTPKPEPPKPTTPPPSNNGGGDGVPNVGDKVIFASGDYYYSSDGQSPAGNEMRGQEVYITSVNNANWAQRKYHISRTPRFGERDLGWVSLDQLRGYASGTKKFVNGSEIVRINEGNNPEMMVRRGALTGTATTITYGDAVVNARLSKNIMDLGEHKDDIYSSLNIANSLGERPNVTNNYYDKMIEVQGSIDKETYPGMKKVIERVTKEFTKEAHKLGMHRTL